MHTIQIDREKEREGWLLGLGQIKCIQIGNKHATGVKKKKKIVVVPSIPNCSRCLNSEERNNGRNVDMPATHTCTTTSTHTWITTLLFECDERSVVCRCAVVDADEFNQ